MSRPRAKLSSIRDPRHKVVYTETYRKPGLRLRGQYLPTLPSATGFHVESAYVMQAGSALTQDGGRLEFQDVRIFLRANTDSTS